MFALLTREDGYPLCTTHDGELYQLLNQHVTNSSQTILMSNLKLTEDCQINLAGGVGADDFIFPILARELIILVIIKHPSLDEDLINIIKRDKMYIDEIQTQEHVLTGS